MRGRAAFLVLVTACGIRAVGTGESLESSAVPSSSSSSGESGAIVTADGDTPSSSDGDADVDGATNGEASVDGGDGALSCTANLDTDLAHCGACFAACPTGSTSCKGGKCLATLRIRVGIDGESYFNWKGAQAQWHQVTYAAPARHPDTPNPMELNTQQFNPTWPNGDGDTQNYSCGCDSSFFTPPVPPLPAKAQTVGLQVIEVRKSITIAEQPAAANNYRLSVEFLDVGVGGSGYYEALLTYETR